MGDFDTGACTRHGDGIVCDVCRPSRVPPPACTDERAWVRLVQRARLASLDPNLDDMHPVDDGDLA